MNRRRFIAGVVCPSCNGADTTAIQDAGALRVRICVVCGYRESLVADETRVARARASAQAEAVQLIEPAGNESGSQ